MPQNKTVSWDYTMVCAGKYLCAGNKKAAVRKPPPDDDHFLEMIFTKSGPRVLIKTCDTIDGNNCFEYLTRRLNIIVIIGRTTKNDIGVTI
jgi:hypothetical protein